MVLKAKPLKFSGLQKEVLSLYRSCLRATRNKPIEKRQHWVNFIHGEFGKYRSIPKRDFSAIEHLLRLGRRRMDMYASPLITDVN
ncbi:hypothetical protein CANARDRAFT_198106 [[Candida] arabinofermentans NRRL YB-2248]|uniref:Complex 1 LYR protein domain-containing protein n=1 Tax=[Candida] arabinofermentans NRRL YB-2248 TaxID=983967 RepID=A0A1E4T2L0_9ASCO|nr:hypothetical protein CANARDRAFT_198106 [[Candida] arabinofermentans NRRL YB-2248]